ncbi:hypothetical protein [Undibacterium sp. TJN19]|uniref:hypothetical protein n=1 Tax=Undibacterium sp. TJN19 TaxID=3413055 RepID=UPI003BF05CA3
MEKIELIKKMLENGRALDLLMIMEGESSYNSPNSEGSPTDRELGTLWVMTIHHLRFVAEFGNKSGSLRKDGKWFNSFPEDFSAWLEAGAPGVSEFDLSQYVLENPLE